MTDKAGYPQAAFGGDTIRTVKLTPQEQAAYASGWNRAIEAAAKAYETCGGAVNDWDWFEAADHAIRALSMPAPAPAQAWRDISTAPKDGTEFLAYWGYGLLDRKAFIQPMKWSEAEEKFIITWDHDDQAHPTHWMPLPVPPAALIPDTEGGA